MGGNSLLIVQAQEKLQSTFQQELSVVDMFQYPTIQTLSNYLSKAKTKTNTISSIERSDNRINTRSDRHKVVKRKRSLRKKYRS